MRCRTHLLAGKAHRHGRPVAGVKIPDNRPLRAYNGLMIETVYKTDSPVREVSECYVLVLTSRAASGRKVYAFMQEHGQWNDELQRFVYTIDSIGASDTLSHQEGLALYEEARRKLAQAGFVHAFRPNCIRKGPQTYERYAAAEAVPA